MTMAIRIKNESKGYVAVVKNADYNPSTDNTTYSEQCRLKPDDETVVYATSTRSIHITEEPL